MVQEELKARWLSLWQRLHATGAPLAIDSQLIKHYTEPHRAYHNLKHIDHCLKELDTVRSLADNPDLIELAIWFHDAIYDPRSKENEVQSAQLAVDTAKKAGLDRIAESLSALILATRHDGAPSDKDQQILVDVDLSILGQPSAIFLEYEKNIRREYSWVAENDFRVGRRKVLQSFLDRPYIYWTSVLRKKYELKARTNLKASIQNL